MEFYLSLDDLIRIIFLGLYQICKKPTEAYGFGHSMNEYTLEEFGKMADQFKLQYFKRPLKVRFKFDGDGMNFFVFKLCLFIILFY